MYLLCTSSCIVSSWRCEFLTHHKQCSLATAQTKYAALRGVREESKEREREREMHELQRSSTPTLCTCIYNWVISESPPHTGMHWRSCTGLWITEGGVAALLTSCFLGITGLLLGITGLFLGISGLFLGITSLSLGLTVV